MFRLITRLFSSAEDAAAPPPPAPVVFQADPQAPAPGPQQAVIYASPNRSGFSIDDEATHERRLTKFDVLLADMMHAPSIESIDLSAYSGRAGEVIRVAARDDFAVTRVLVRIENADGSLVETGDARQQTNPLEWAYTTTAANDSLAGDKITIRVNDRPGNLDEQTLTL